MSGPMCSQEIGHSSSPVTLSDTCQQEKKLYLPDSSKESLENNSSQMWASSDHQKASLSGIKGWNMLIGLNRVSFAPGPHWRMMETDSVRDVGGGK